MIQFNLVSIEKSKGYREKVLLVEYNIYCDESCHLEHDMQRYMILGGIICEKDDRKIIKKDLISIKLENQIKENTEIKWNKVSPSKLKYYKELVDYFFNSDLLRFRAMIIDKNQIDHERFNQTHDDWYYKMYYELLKNLAEPKADNYIYLDIKDTKSARKVEVLRNYLNTRMKEFEYEPIKRIQSINSQESAILQLADLLIGAIGYKNREMFERENSSNAKTELMKYIADKSGYSLLNSTLLSEKKFNLFHIDLQVGVRFE